MCGRARTNRLEFCRWFGRRRVYHYKLFASGRRCGGARMMAGQNNGEVWEWHASTGWKIVPGSEGAGPNGLEISKDGKWLYIGGWGSQSFIRLSRGQTPIKKDSVPVGFRLDNLR